jgi:ferredoxin
MSSLAESTSHNILPGKILLSPEFSLDQCIKCTICTTACPVAAVTDLFPGPKYEGPQAGRFRMPGQNSPDHSVDYCSGCRVCNMVCPNGVKIAELNARARAASVYAIISWLAPSFWGNLLIPSHPSLIACSIYDSPANSLSSLLVFTILPHCLTSAHRRLPPGSATVQIRSIRLKK